MLEIRVGARRSSLLVAALVAWLTILPAAASADGGAYQGRITVDPAAAGGSTADCARIPAVHHRMYGIRGARDEDGDENTIWGMQQSYDAGVRWFETDLQALLSDEEQAARRAGTWTGGHHGALVLFHDDTLDRTTPASGRIRLLTYEQLPRTSTGRRIPTLNAAFRWLHAHPGTHLLVEVTMMVPWGRVNRLLERYGFTDTNRVIFDVNRADAEKRAVAVALARELHAPTGVKTWPEDRPASWLTQFGSSVRVNYTRATRHLDELKAAGIRHRFSKIANGRDDQPPEEQWAAMVTSGAYRHIITERSAEYVAWCAAQQQPPDPAAAGGGGDAR